MSALRAAAGAVDLHPVVGSRLTGFALRLEPSIGIHDPLRAKLLLVDDGTTRLLWIACDLIGFDPSDDAELRRLVATALSMPATHVLVSCTHTHSGPSSMPFRGPLTDVDASWLARMSQAVVDEAVALASRLRPARLTHTVCPVPGIGFNRQDNVSPIDERLLVAQFSDERNDVIATILNYATHPVVLGDKNLLFSADFPGYATRFIKEQIGGVAMFVQGSAGDVNPFIFRDHPRNAGTFEVAEQMGRALATAARGAITHAPRSSDVQICVAEQHVELPLAPAPSADELARLREEFATRDPRWAMFELMWADELERAISRRALPSSLTITISGVRIGNLFSVTFPLEIYSQIGLDVRQHLAPRDVIIAAYTNGLLGYAPTDRAIDQGGYGPATSHRFFRRLLTPLDRGCASLLTHAATKLVNSLCN